MTIAVASTTSISETASTSSLSHDHTVSSANNLLIVFVLWVDNSTSAAPSVTGVTFGGAALTYRQQSQYQYTAGRYVVAEIWTLTNPSVSTAAVVASISEATAHGFAVVAVTVTGANKFRNAGTTNGDSATPSLTLNGTGLTLAGFAARGGDLYPATWDSPATSLVDGQSGPLAANDIAFSVAAGVANTLSATMAGSDYWAVAGIEVIENFVLTVQDSSHDHTATNAAATFHPAAMLTVADAAHEHRANTLNVRPILIVNDGNQAHAVESPGLTQHYSIAVQDAAHQHNVNTFNLRPILIVAETRHWQIVDPFGLTQHYAALGVTEAAHQQLADAVTVTYRPKLAVQDSSHYQAAESVDTVVDLIVLDTSHYQGSESPGLTQHNTLVVADAHHSQIVDNFALIATGSVIIQSADHGHSADAVALTQHGALIVQSADHWQEAQQPPLAQHGAIAVQEAAHGHAADSGTVSPTTTLTVADVAHGQIADSTVLRFVSLLIVADVHHYQAAEHVTIIAIASVHEARHTQTADNVVLVQRHQLSVQDAMQGHTVDSAALLINSYMLVVLATVAMHSRQSGEVRARTVAVAKSKARFTAMMDTEA